MRERCPYCTERLEQILIRRCQDGTRVVKLDCPNARCSFNVVDYDIPGLSRPAGTPFKRQNKAKKQARHTDTSSSMQPTFRVENMSLAGAPNDDTPRRDKDSLVAG